MMIKDFEQPIIDIDEPTGKVGYLVRAIPGLLNGKAFPIRMTAASRELCLKAIDQAWENEKKNHYGPNTYVKTVRNGCLPKADKYRHGDE